MDSASLVSSLHLGTTRAYDRAAVDAYLEHARTERERLRVAIADTEARLAAVAAPAPLEAQLIEVILATEQRLAERRRVVRDEIAAIEREAATEADACLAAARLEVELLESAIAHLTAGRDAPVTAVPEPTVAANVIDLRSDAVAGVMAGSS